MRARLQRIDDLLGIFEARCHDFGLVASGIDERPHGTDRLEGIDRIVQHPVHIRCQIIASGCGGQDPLVRRIDQCPQDRSFRIVLFHFFDCFQACLCNGNLYRKSVICIKCLYCFIIGKHFFRSRTQQLYKKFRRLQSQ